MIVRYGVIGCGAIAQRRHIPECVANPDSKLVALADPVRRPRRDAGQEVRRQALHRLQGNAQVNADIDAVVVAGPNTHARPQTHRGPERRQARPVREADGHHPRRRQGHDRRGQEEQEVPDDRPEPAADAPARARPRRSSTAAGSARSWRSARRSSTPAPRAGRVDAGKSWFFKKGEAFMGVTGDLGVHKADLLRWLLGQEFTEVGGFISTLDKRDPEGKLIDARRQRLPDPQDRRRRHRLDDPVLDQLRRRGELHDPLLPEGRAVAGHRPDLRRDRRLQATASARCTRSARCPPTSSRCPAASSTCSPKSITRTSRRRSTGWKGYRSLDVILTAMEAAKAGKTMKIGE